ncbi:unnamed protein product, partial [Medioppia subpectinata]
TPNVCDEGWVAYRDEKCYRVFNTTPPMTYAQSVEFCAGLQALPFSTTLATIHTADEQSFLTHYLAGVFADGTNVWIGARRRRRSRTDFQWTDGTDMEYNRWLSGQPADTPGYDCVTMKSRYLAPGRVETDGQWANVLCGSAQVALCQRLQYWTYQQSQPILMATRRRTNWLSDELDALRRLLNATQHDRDALKDDLVDTKNELRDLRLDVYSLMVNSITFKKIHDILPAVPLVVKSPYLSTWLVGRELSGDWARFYTGAHTSMTGFVRVDSQAYRFMGAHYIAHQNILLAIQSGLRVTPTQSVFTFTAGPIELVVNFFTPIDPTDLKRLSLPASYISMSARSVDHKTHEVQVYLGMTGEWVTSDLNQVIEWDVREVKGKSNLINELPEWGTIKFFTESTATYEANFVDTMRSKFVKTGKLDNTVNRNYRKVSDNWPGIGFARTLTAGTTHTAANTVYYGVAHVRRPAIEYTDSHLNQLWESYFNGDDKQMIDFFYEDREDALRRATALDKRIVTDAQAVGGESYVKVVSAALRQAYGGVEMVGTVDRPWMMLNDGVCQTVDAIYPHFAVQLYLNPTLLRYLLEPLLDNQERDLFPNKYCLHDLGTYPKCNGQVGHDLDMEVEESANMLIMMSAYVRATNDTEFAKKHYKIAKQWTQYLVDHGLITGDALTTDAYLGKITNSTNLSAKAIIGIGAMAQLAEVTGNEADRQQYRQTAEKYITEWIGLSKDPSNKYLKMSYNTPDKWFAMYNLYADVLLDTKLVPESIYAQQDEWYQQVMNVYGLPLGSDSVETLIDWIMLTAAASGDTKLRQSLFDRTAKWLRETPTRMPLPDHINTVTGVDVLPAVPLVVKSPYLSTWMTGRQLGGEWTRFWDTAYVRGMAGMVRVDSQTYVFMGNPVGDGIDLTLPAMESGLRVTPTQSVFTFTAGPIELVVNFFTPIDPTDLKRLLPDAFAHLVMAVVSFRRIRAYLRCEELDNNCVAIADSDSTSIDDEFNAVSLRKCSFGWSRDSEPILKDISLDIKRGSLVAIVGRVGAGKSSIFSALMGDMYQTAGDRRLAANQSIAYVPQTAWIQNQTLRQNIVFVSDYESERYQQVVKACALDADFAILPARDLTEIGEKGINLSGGQKHRVSLARAVYSGADLYLLDDPLAAVDAHVGQHLYREVIGRQGLLRNKTRVLATHHVSYLKDADQIVVISEGRIVDAGDYDALVARGMLTEQVLNGSDDNVIGGNGGVRRQSSRESDSQLIRRQLSRQKSLLKDNTEDNTIDECNVKDGQLVDDESTQFGSIKLLDYKYYVSRIGPVVLAVSIVTMFLAIVCEVGSNYWINVWTSGNHSLSDTSGDTNNNNGYFLGIYVSAIVLYAIFTLGSTLLYRVGLVRVSALIHSDLLNSVMRTPLSFFDVTPTGRIINRFNRDIEMIGLLLPWFMYATILYGMQAITIMAVIVYTIPIIIVMIVIVAIVFAILYRISLWTTRQLNRMNSITRSPIYSHFNESIAGAVSIRAYKTGHTFTKTLQKFIDTNLNVQKHTVAANMCVSIWTAIIGSFITFSAALFVVLKREDMTPGLAGFVLIYSFEIITSISWALRFVSETETEMVCVERIREYSQLEPEFSWDSPPESKPHGGKHCVLRRRSRQTTGH